MKRKIIAIFLLSIFFVCNIGTVFAEDTNNNNENGNGESTQITETIDEENADNQEEADKVEEENENEEAIKKRDGGEEVYFNVTFVYAKTEVKKVKNGEKAIPPKIKLDKGEAAYWYDEEGERFDFDTPITRDMKLILEISLTNVLPVSRIIITFDTNGGSKVDDIALRDSYIDYLPTTSKPGYKFLGWFDKSGKEWKVGMRTSDDLDLYAKWQPLNLSSAKTGDSSKAGLYLGMMLIASAGIYLSLKGLKRKKYE